MLLGGKILNFPSQTFRDAWVARGGVDYLMRRFQWLKFGHVSDLEWSLGRPLGSVIMTGQVSGLEAFFQVFEAFFLVFILPPTLTPRFLYVAYITQT
jgi:hypothetical protein